MTRGALPLRVQPAARGASSGPARAARDLESSHHQISNTPSDICRSPAEPKTGVCCFATNRGPDRFSAAQSCRANYPMKRVAQSSSGIDLMFTRFPSGFESTIDIVLRTGSMKSDFNHRRAALTRSLREVAMRNAIEEFRQHGRSYAARPVDGSDRGTSGGAGRPQLCVVV
jgi:hypothetical protein